MSEVITECIKRGLGIGPDETVQVYTTGSGFPTITLGRPITAEDVRSLDDDE